ncbi:MAG: ABC transporter substrate-binding protein [Thermomicrobiales bacterium]
MHGRFKLWSILVTLALVVPVLSVAGAIRVQAQDECAAGTTPTGDPVKIGVILPLSGTAATVGNDEKLAVELAIQIVNEATADVALPLAATVGLPNLGCAQVELIFADSQGKAEVGQSEATRLIDQEEVVALFGAYNSAVTKTASTAAERAGIPFLNAESSSPDLTERDFVWFFRTSPHDGAFSESIFDFIDYLNDEKAAGIKSVGLMYEDTDFGVNSAAAETAEAEERGLQVMADVKYKSNATSLTSEIQKLQSDGGDALIPSSYTSDTILAVQTMEELGYLPKMIVAQDAGYADPAFIDAVGPLAEGISTRSAFSIDITGVKPVASTVNDLYSAVAEKDMYDVPARGFTGMMVLLDAINRAGSTDPEAIRQALVETDLGVDETIMPWQGVTFDDQQQNELGIGIIVQIQDGQYKTVFPLDFAVEEVVYPLAPWDQRGE